MGVGRPSMGLVTVKVGLPEELLRRLDADGLNRSEWVRESCEMRLAGLTPVRDVRDDPVEKPVAVELLPVRPFVPKRTGKRDWSGDFPAVEAAIAEHRYSTRDLAKRLGWPEMKLDRVLEAMSLAGKIRFERGAVVPA